MRDIIRTVKVPYCDSAQGEDIWEAVGNEESMMIRRQFKIHFHKRPAFVAGKIESNFGKAIITETNLWFDWVVDKCKNIKVEPFPFRTSFANKSRPIDTTKSEKSF